MKIAWIGPMVRPEGGAVGVGLQLLEELGSRDVEVDCYMPGEFGSVPQQLRQYESLSFHCIRPLWNWNRWYSRNNFMAFATGQFANWLTEYRLTRVLYRKHLSQPYELIYQFSHIESSFLRRHRTCLPPIVIHPSVHAAGELRWHKRETCISRKTEKLVLRLGVRLLLTIRNIVQHRHVRIPSRILALSQNFAHDLSADYGVPLSDIDVIPNPIDLNLFCPAPDQLRVLNHNPRTIILFVSRIALRKGVEQVVELSHRLDDLADKIEIHIVGYKSLWSDYMGLLNSLNPRTARYIAALPHHEMAQLYRSADLLVQPSKYEPFGLTVGEALACGVPVVASDKVGAAESVHPLCCRRFAHNDTEAFETEIRQLLEDLSDNSLKHRISALSRTEAERLFSSSVVGDKLLQSFATLISGNAHTTDTVIE